MAAGLPALALGLAGFLIWAVVPVPAAEAATTPKVPAEAGLASANQRVAADRARAAAISAEIQSEGLLLAKYAERADAESVRSAQLDIQLGKTDRAAKSATADVAGAKTLLVAQAIAAYTEGGAFSYRPGSVQGSGLVVAAAYAEAVAQRQQLALSDYRSALARDQTVFAELSRQKASVRAATRQLTADRSAASRQQSSLRATLGGVKGDLALAVAEVEKQQAAVQAEEEEALLRSLDQLPKATPVMAAQRSPAAGGLRAGAGSPASRGVASDGITTVAPTTATSAAEPAVPVAALETATAPSTTTTSAPPTTSPPSTTTSTAPVTTSSSTTTLPPTTTTTTSPPSTTSTTTSLSATTTAVTSTGVSSLTASSVTASSVPASSVPASSAAAATSSTLESATTTVPLSSSTSVADIGDAYGSGSGGNASPTTVTPATTTTTQPASAADSGLPAAGWQVAMAFAESQIGKPYKWGGAGPATYDCSGLTMVAWSKAGVYMPHSAQDQYDMTARVPIAELQPGDLVFFGTPTDVYHVGMYVGGGSMVDAPETGQDVMIQPIYELNLLAGGRPA